MYIAMWWTFAFLEENLDFDQNLPIMEQISKMVKSQICDKWQF